MNRVVDTALKMYSLIRERLLRANIQCRASAAGTQLRQRQAVDERHADSGPLQALVRVADGRIRPRASAIFRQQAEARQKRTKLRDKGNLHRFHR